MGVPAAQYITLGKMDNLFQLHILEIGLHEYRVKKILIHSHKSSFWCLKVFTNTERHKYGQT